MPAPHVIIGGGAAGAYAARALAERGIRVVLLTDEAVPPYDRTVLTKAALLGGETELPPLWPDAPWRDLIEVRTAVTATRIDPAAHTVTLASSADLPYAALLLATGAEPRRLPAFGDAFVIRTVADLEALRAALPESGRALVLGGGVIGLETAAALRELGHEVEVVEAADRVLARGIPEPIATWLAARHEERGVRLRTDTVLESPPDGFDLVVVGVGVTPRVELARAAGVHCDNGIVTDLYGRTDLPDVYAAGDCANWDGVRHEAWNVAGEQGAVVGATMAGEPAPWVGPATTWSDQYDATLHAVGRQGPQDETVVVSTPELALVLAFDPRDPSRLTYACGVSPGALAARPIRAAQRVIAAEAPVPREELAGALSSADARTIATVLLGAAKAKS
ncbi:MAG: FAD-dependent oxidoreductase [Phycicoccus sp.]|nr:FAD-dependent oxidoreductase [Phycicoccus sp.]